MIRILIKKSSPEIKLPKYETKGSSGMDISAFIKGRISIKPNKHNQEQPRTALQYNY